MRIDVTKAHRLDQLTDELFAAFPGWRTVGPDGRPRTAVSISSDGDTVTVDFPDGTDPAAVEAAIAAHTPTADYTAQPGLRQARRYLRNTIWPKLDALTDTAVLTNLERDRTFKSILIILRDIYQAD